MLVQLVKKEAENLRKFAKKSELKKLNIDTLRVDSIYRCIYGQMTGDCFSTRANNLIIKCCERVYTAGNNKYDIVKSSKLNGAPTKVKGYERKNTYFSPIEKYIVLREGKQEYLERLVDYLKGDSDELKLK